MEVLIKAFTLAVIIYLIIFTSFSIAGTGHIYNLQKEGGWWWWALAENDVYYDDTTYLIIVSNSKSNADAGAYFPVTWGVSSKWARLDSDRAEAYIHAWFSNILEGSYWESYCYAWTDPPDHGGYHFSE